MYIVEFGSDFLYFIIKVQGEKKIVLCYRLLLRYWGDNLQLGKQLLIIYDEYWKIFKVLGKFILFNSGILKGLIRDRGDSVLGLRI